MRTHAVDFSTHATMAVRRVELLAATSTDDVRHEHESLAFITQGAMTVTQRGQTYALAEGAVYVVPSGQAHGALRGTVGSAWALGFCASCYVTAEYPAMMAPFERARRGASPVLTLPPERRPHLDWLFSALEREVNAAVPSIYADLAQRNLLALILTEVNRAASFVPADASSTTVVSEALAYVEAHCLERVSLAQVARAVRRSPAYVATAVKAATGRTVVEWLTYGRMAEARRRLTHTGERVDVIAERVSYTDVTHFVRVFRRTHGTTPAAWRAERRHPPAAAEPNRHDGTATRA